MLENIIHSISRCKESWKSPEQRNILGRFSTLVRREKGKDSDNISQIWTVYLFQTS